MQVKTPQELSLITEIFMKTYGLTQTELAVKSLVKQPYISKLLTNKTKKLSNNSTRLLEYIKSNNYSIISPEDILNKIVKEYIEVGGNTDILYQLISAMIKTIKIKSAV